jgi:prevent-host-death family protein
LAVVDMHWQVQEVKQRLSEVLRAAETHGVQYVTRHGKEVAVVMSVEEYRRLAGHTYGSFNEALLSMPTVDTPGVFDRRGDTEARATPQLDWD